jgi:hypothetical protein
MDGSVIPSSNAGSIMLASHASDFHDSLDNDELDAYFAEEDHGESFSQANVFMATGDENDDAPDHFSTPLPTNATAEQIEQHAWHSSHRRERWSRSARSSTSNNLQRRMCRATAPPALPSDSKLGP